MSKEHAGVSTRTSRVIRAPREEFYAAFLDPTALADWLPPAKMTGEIHELDARVGGGYRMSPFYASRSALSAVRRPTGDGGLPQPSPNDARSSAVSPRLSLRGVQAETRRQHTGAGMLFRSAAYMRRVVAFA